MRGEQGRSRVRWRVVLNSLAFIFGFSLVFVSLGASASFLGSLFMGYRNEIRILGGVFILIVGLYLVGAFKIAALEQYLQFNLKDKPAGYFGSVLVGITFAVGLDALRRSDPRRHTGVGQHFRRNRPRHVTAESYAAGLALPFFLSALAINSFLQFSQQLRRYIQAIHVGRRHALDHRRHPVDHGLHDLFQRLRAAFHPTWLLQRL